VADIAAQARAGKPLSYASFGNGTSAHLAGEMLKTALNAPGIVHVPYKGQAPALADLLGGQVTMMFGNWPEFRGHVASGKLVAIGMATASARNTRPTSHAGRAGRQGGVQLVERHAGARRRARRDRAARERGGEPGAARTRGGRGAAQGRHRRQVGHAGAVRRLHPDEIARYAQVIRQAGITQEA
jgi:hypothetical protein